MRVVSLVPSWTETLLEAGVEVVGRTRFCIHPRAGVENIPRVGGTKDWNWAKILSLKPDLLLLDKEENPKFMSEQSEIPFYASDVRGAHDMPKELTKLSEILHNKTLNKWADEWSEILKTPLSKDRPLDQDFPGLIDWGLKPESREAQFLYLIWRDPWMSVGTGTFIGSMLKQLGIPTVGFDERYPKIDLGDFDRAKTVLLFSSEPFPFLKHRQDLVKLGFAHAFVDGEKFSWFGLRALRFLQLTKR